MTVWLASLYVFNFLAPAAGMGLCLSVCEGLATRQWPWSPQLRWALVQYFLAGVSVLMLGLAVWGRDGKVATYVALVTVMGALAAWRTRSWA
jgi:hypothetical protein